MLKGINPLLTPELLKIMMEMGHDEALVLTDANFTAMSIAAGKPVVRLPGTSMLQVVEAVTGEMQPFGNFILRKGVIVDTLRP